MYLQVVSLSPSLFKIKTSVVHIYQSVYKGDAIAKLNFAKSLHCLYLHAAYLCICVPVNSQFKYLSNIPSQYRATCQTLSIRNRHKLSAFFANSRSPTYDKEARSEVGWVFCENTAGKQFCHPAQFC